MMVRENERDGRVPWFSEAAAYRAAQAFSEATFELYVSQLERERNALGVLLAAIRKEKERQLAAEPGETGVGNGPPITSGGESAPASGESPAA